MPRQKNGSRATPTEQIEGIWGHEAQNQQVQKDTGRTGRGNSLPSGPVAHLRPMRRFRKESEHLPDRLSIHRELRRKYPDGRWTSERKALLFLLLRGGFPDCRTCCREALPPLHPNPNLQSARVHSSLLDLTRPVAKTNRPPSIVPARGDRILQMRGELCQWAIKFLELHGAGKVKKTKEGHALLLLIFPQDECEVFSYFVELGG